eukprot:scaffold3418_cov124-Isochrysis_galbana.AAC.33
MPSDGRQAGLRRAPFPLSDVMYCRTGADAAANPRFRTLAIFSRRTIRSLPPSNARPSKE